MSKSITLHSITYLIAEYSTFKSLFNLPNGHCKKTLKILEVFPKVNRAWLFMIVMEFSEFIWSLMKFKHVALYFQNFRTSSESWTPLGSSWWMIDHFSEISQKYPVAIDLLTISHSIIHTRYFGLFSLMYLRD